MNRLQLEYLIALLLLVHFLLKVDAHPAPHSTSSLNDTSGVRPIGGSEANDESFHEFTRDKEDDHKFEFDYKQPDARVSHRTNNKESIERLLERTRVLLSFDARLAARVQATLEELSHDEQRLLEHASRESSAENGWGIERSKRYIKPPRRAPYDLFCHVSILYSSMVAKVVRDPFQRSLLFYLILVLYCHNLNSVCDKLIIDHIVFLIGFKSYIKENK